MCLEIIYLIYMYKNDLALNNLQSLICHETHPNPTQPNQTEPNQISSNSFKNKITNKPYTHKLYMCNHLTVSKQMTIVKFNY